MLKILLFAAVATVATLPSVGIATLYLKRRGIPVGEDETVVSKLMEVAPMPLKAGLVTLNFALLGAILFALWSWSSS